jgi:UDP-N-acetylglucosamine acyltransferase
MAHIHSTAIVAAGASLAPDVVVGPYCIVGERVELGLGVTLGAHVVIEGRTTIGAGTRVFPFASIGHEPQDLKYRGEDSSLVIGCRNTIREYVTMNPGTTGGGLITRVGNDCLFMAGTHIAHDCQIGDHVIMANNSILAGHVTVDEYAFLGGVCAVHQFVRIGRHAMIGGMSGAERDIIPYGQVIGVRARLTGLNIIGMQRRGFSREEIQALRNAYQLLFHSEGTFSDRVGETARRFAGVRPVEDIIEFIRADSSRGILHPQEANGG